MTAAVTVSVILACAASALAAAAVWTAHQANRQLVDMLEQTRLWAFNRIGDLENRLASKTWDVYAQVSNGTVHPADRLVDQQNTRRQPAGGPAGYDRSHADSQQPVDPREALAGLDLDGPTLGVG